MRFPLVLGLSVLLLSGCGVNFAPVDTMQPCSPAFVADYNQITRVSQSALLGFSKVSDAMSLTQSFRTKYAGRRCFADVEPAFGGPKRRVVLDATETADRLLRALRTRIL